MGLSAFCVFEADIVGLRREPGAGVNGLDGLSLQFQSPITSAHAYFLVTTSPAVPAVVNIFRLSLIACSRADHRNYYTNLRTLRVVSEHITVYVSTRPPKLLTTHPERSCRMVFTHPLDQPPFRHPHSSVH